MEPVNSEGRRLANIPIPVPGMTQGMSVGLGSVLKRTTLAVGNRPCGGCEEGPSRMDTAAEIRGGSPCCR